MFSATGLKCRQAFHLHSLTTKPSCCNTQDVIWHRLASISWDIPDGSMNAMLQNLCRSTLTVPSQMCELPKPWAQRTFIPSQMLPMTLALMEIGMDIFFFIPKEHNIHDFQHNLKYVLIKPQHTFCTLHQLRSDPTKSAHSRCCSFTAFTLQDRI